MASFPKDRAAVTRTSQGFVREPVDRRSMVSSMSGFDFAIALSVLDRVLESSPISGRSTLIGLNCQAYSEQATLPFSPRNQYAADCSRSQASARFEDAAFTACVASRGGPMGGGTSMQSKTHCMTARQDSAEPSRSTPFQTAFKVSIRTLDKTVEAIWAQIGMSLGTCCGVAIRRWRSALSRSSNSSRDQFGSRSSALRVEAKGLLSSFPEKYHKRAFNAEHRMYMFSVFMPVLRC
mmetsp:Transcript_8699/g.32067  ORF Transcript_8699/g.32067 Transcript_8699/m.32067 type:complete len:236 (+) Transcript_8699:4875-5582(+)